jgi:hypothetical protein
MISRAKKPARCRIPTSCFRGETGPKNSFSTVLIKSKLQNKITKSDFVRTKSDVVSPKSDVFFPKSDVEKPKLDLGKNVSLIGI